MKPDRWQQLVSALAVLLVVAATVAAVFLLALGGDGLRLVGLAPTNTPFIIPTIGEQAPTVVRPDEEEVVPLTMTSDVGMDETEVTVTQTPTSTDTSEVAHTPTSIPCQVRVGWQAYTVQDGETLAAISRNYGLTAGALEAGSCLNSQVVQPGDMIFVPASTPTLTPPPNDSADIRPTGTQTATDGACSNPDSVIAQPEVGDQLSGTVAFYGTARLPDFSYYKLEIRPESSSAEDYVTFHTSETSVASGLLYNLDTRAFDDGSYWIRLVVVNETGNYPERCAILYSIQN